jgi:hypothetical protein
MLQRTVGNHVTAAVLQRWIKFKPNLTLDAAWAARQADLDEWILARYTNWVGRKRIPVETATAIRAKVKEWILDDVRHAKPGGKHFMGYDAIFEMARAQVGAAAPLAATPEELEMPDAAPLSPPITQTDPDDLQDIVPAFRRAGSEVRELGPAAVEDGGDADRAERRRHRNKEYSDKVKPRMLAVPYDRRRRDRASTVGPEPQRFSFGPYGHEIQGGSSHRMTNEGGGAAPTYEALIRQLLLAAAPADDQAIATQVRALLEQGTLPTLSEPSTQVLAELFAVVQGPEMSRSSVALDAFAAAIHWVAEGRGSLEQAFVGAGAVYLGANKGGAAALRGTVADLSDAENRRNMTRQTGRAESVMAAWAARFVDASLGGETRAARLREIHQQVLTNMQRFAAQLTQRPGAPVAATHVPSGAPDGPPPGY